LPLGYLDGFFSTLPTSTHTTVTNNKSHRERGGCHADNCTKTTPTPTPVPIPPSPTPHKGNGT